MNGVCCKRVNCGIPVPSRLGHKIRCKSSSVLKTLKSTYPNPRKILGLNRRSVRGSERQNSATRGTRMRARERGGEKGMARERVSRQSCGALRHVFGSWSSWTGFVWRIFCAALLPTVNYFMHSGWGIPTLGKPTGAKMAALLSQERLLSPCCLKEMLEKMPANTRLPASA